MQNRSILGHFNLFVPFLSYFAKPQKFNLDMANEFTNLKKALEDYMNEVSRIYKGKLTSDGHKATGKLIGSVKVEVSIGPTQYTGELRLEDYWKYIEYGTKPHWPPPKSILKWINAKPILPRAINGITPSKDQLAYLIGRKISKVGTKAGNELGDTIDEVNAKYRGIIEAAVEKDLSGELTLIFNNF